MELHLAVYLRQKYLNRILLFLIVFAAWTANFASDDIPLKRSISDKVKEAHLEATFNIIRESIQCFLLENELAYAFHHWKSAVQQKMICELKNLQDTWKNNKKKSSKKLTIQIPNDDEYNLKAPQRSLRYNLLKKILYEELQNEEIELQRQDSLKEDILNTLTTHYLLVLQKINSIREKYGNNIQVNDLAKHLETIHNNIAINIQFSDECDNLEEDGKQYLSELHCLQTTLECITIQKIMEQPEVLSKNGPVSIYL